MAKQEELTKNINQTQTRLKRASKLTTGLADEQVRWAESVKVRRKRGRRRKNKKTIMYIVFIIYFSIETGGRG